MGLWNHIRYQGLNAWQAPTQCTFALVTLIAFIFKAENSYFESV